MILITPFSVQFLADDVLEGTEATSLRGEWKSYVIVCRDALTIAMFFEIKVDLEFCL